MAKPGQARVLTAAQQQHLFDVIKEHRHPEKNAAIMQVSFKRGLRAQEIALLEIKEVAARTAAGTDFKPLEVMGLPAAYTKRANTLNRQKRTDKRQSVTFTVNAFKKTVRQTETLAKAGATINPEDFFPALKRHTGNSRDLPLVDDELREALIAYLEVHLDRAKKLKPSDRPFW
jgi:hypothetical protein